MKKVETKILIRFLKAKLPRETAPDSKEYREEIIKRLEEWEEDSGKLRAIKEMVEEIQKKVYALRATSRIEAEGATPVLSLLGKMWRVLVEMISNKQEGK